MQQCGERSKVEIHQKQIALSRENEMSRDLGLPGKYQFAICSGGRNCQRSPNLFSVICCLQSCERLRTARKRRLMMPAAFADEMRRRAFETLFA